MSSALIYEIVIHIRDKTCKIISSNNEENL